MNILSLIALSIFLFHRIIGQTSCDIHGYSASYNETLIGDQRHIVANGCPNHDSTCLGKPAVCTDHGVSLEITDAVEFPKDINIPTYPCISDVAGGVNTTCFGGAIGIMLNGVSLFSQTAGGVDCEDAILAEFTAFNLCGGHSTGVGQFHYHVAPACLLYQLGDHGTTNQDLQHSPQIGWSLDGFPIYGPHGLNGEYIYKCGDQRSNESDCLDSCNGHMQHTIDGFKYHYHVTGPIGDLQGNIKMDPISPVPDGTMFPYTIGCFKGIPTSGWRPIFRRVECAMDGTTDDYVPQITNGVTIVYPELVIAPTSTTLSATLSTTSASASTNSYISISELERDGDVKTNIFSSNPTQLLIYGAVGLTVICLIGAVLFCIKCRKKKVVEYSSPDTKTGLQMMDNSADNEQQNIALFGNTLKPTNKGHHIPSTSSGVWVD